MMMYRFYPESRRSFKAPRERHMIKYYHRSYMMGQPPKVRTTGKERQGAPEEQRQENAKKAKEAAERLYPREKWEPLEAGIFISKNRMPRSAEQIKVQGTSDGRVIQAGSFLPILRSAGSSTSGAKRNLGKKNPCLAAGRLSRENRIYRNTPDDLNVLEPCGFVKYSLNEVPQARIAPSCGKIALLIPKARQKRLGRRLNTC
jgi:hypothetical protein